MPRRRSVNAVHTNMNEYVTLIQHCCLWAIDNLDFFVSTLSNFSSLILSFRYCRLHCNNPPSANLWAESLWVHTDGKEAAERSGLSAQDWKSRNQKDEGQGQQKSETFDFLGIFTRWWPRAKVEMDRGLAQQTKLFEFSEGRFPISPTIAAPKVDHFVAFL